MSAGSTVLTHGTKVITTKPKNNPPRPGRTARTTSPKGIPLILQATNKWTLHQYQALPDNLRPALLLTALNQHQAWHYCGGYARQLHDCQPASQYRFYQPTHSEPMSIDETIRQAYSSAQLASSRPYLIYAPFAHGFRKSVRGNQYHGLLPYGAFAQEDRRSNALC